MNRVQQAIARRIPADGEIMPFVGFLSRFWPFNDPWSRARRYSVFRGLCWIEWSVYYVMWRMCGRKV